MFQSQRKMELRNVEIQKDQVKVGQIAAGGKVDLIMPSAHQICRTKLPSRKHKPQTIYCNYSVITIEIDRKQTVTVSESLLTIRDDQTAGM